MKIKPGANIQGLDIAMRPVLKHAERIWKEAGFKDGITVTCGMDGEHSAGSLHYYGRAIDIRIWYIDDAGAQQYLAADTLAAACYQLQRSLLTDYDVISHAGSHVHVEYDPKYEN